jgi:hypothetical protein
MLSRLGIDPAIKVSSILDRKRRGRSVYRCTAITRNACSPPHARSIILRKTQPPVSFVIVVLLRKTWQISESLSGDNEVTSVVGFRVPQHQKRVLVKNLLR